MRRAALPLLLLAAGPASAQEAPPLALRLGVSPEGPVWIGQRVTVTLTAMTPVRFAAPPRFPDLAPEGRALVLPEATTVPGTERVGGQSLVALQHSYDLFPTKAGALVLPALRLEASVGGPDGRPLATAATAPGARVAVRGAPPGVSDLTRLAVTPALRLSAETDRSPEGLRVGQAITRRLRIEAEDTAAMLLPAAQWGTPDGVAVYPDPPVLQDRTDRGVLRALRLESAAFVPQRPGPVELPGFAIAWFDPRGGRLREMQVDPIRFVALPAGEAPAEAAAPPRRWPAWLAAAAALLAAGGGALLTWHRRRSVADPVRDSFARLAAACRMGEASAAMAALFRWCDAVLPPDGRQDGIVCLATLARSPDLLAEARRLEARLYGSHPVQGAWSGAALQAAARRAMRRLRHPAPPSAQGALPALNPGGAAAAPARVVLRNWAR